MVNPSGRLAQLRKRVSDRNERKKEEADEEGRLARLKRKAGKDVSRVTGRVTDPLIPAEAEARQTRREASRLRKTLADSPEAERARAAAKKAQEKRDDLDRMASNFEGDAAGFNAAQVADELEAQGAKSLEEFGGMDTGPGSMGTGVEQPLTFEAVDQGAEPDGDYFDDIVDPVEGVEAGMEEGPVEDGF